MVETRCALSVIIPTRNRPRLLTQAVDHLLAQATTVDFGFEVLVIDDGSTMDIRSPVERLARERGHQAALRYFCQEPRGPAAARNLGIREAKGEVVLFLGDDILARSGLLQAHVTAHDIEFPSREYAVLGLADLAPELCDTPFVQWWRRWNFRYWLLLEGRRQPDYSFFYTNNLSLKRSFLLECGLFDESFRYAAYEDGELGYRLTRHGLQVVFKPEARADHYHRIDLDAACRRMVVKGRAYDLFIEKTGMYGVSQIWSAMGSGPWMRPLFIRPLYRLADWSQTRVALGPVYILVLMYCFQVARGCCSPIPEIPALQIYRHSEEELDECINRRDMLS